MDIQNVKNTPIEERRTITLNVRVTPSQFNFIKKNNLSITKIANEALKQLGYVPPKPEEIPPQNKEGYDEGDVYWKTVKVRVKGGRYVIKKIKQYRPKQN